jgi:hypothetical protein
LPKLNFKEYFMKNTIKALAIIALVAVIGFSFAACGNGNGNGGGGGGGGGGTTGSWPPANVREQHGIGGLDQPPNTSVNYWTAADELIIYFTPTNANDTKTYLNNWFTSNGWTLGMNTVAMTSWTKGIPYPMALYQYSDDSGMAALTVHK